MSENLPAQAQIEPKPATAIVIGAGPAGLMAAEQLAASGCRVTVFDRMPSVGRKFLMAGRGGLNLTHSEDKDAFLARYAEAAPGLAPVLEAFPPSALRDWAAELGEPTFVGSSGRVFPRGFKASPLLRAWLRRLARAGVTVRPRHQLAGFGPDGLPIIQDAMGQPVPVEADVVVLALGGASWPRLGSTGHWVDMLAARGVSVRPLVASNCGFETAWSEMFSSRFAGTPLKPLALSFGGREVRGEAMVTAQGLEGGAIYALSAVLRDAIAAQGEAVLNIDLRPDLDVSALVQRLSRPRAGQSSATFLRKAAGLQPVAVALLREVSRELPAEAEPLARLIKAVPVRLTGPRPIERAISSAGGVRFSDCDAGLMLTKLPGVFVCGEMLDWEAPTGGYLLQACFATGFVAGRAAAQYVRRGA
ncbi:MAG: aminoacetone oxidase family FAD-binding enzyme [Hyphomicrobiales bacterium]|nr:aminoacetone oxidase family FAD-binding enzyme [Hyphomicrobiales bacterium]